MQRSQRTPLTWIVALVIAAMVPRASSQPQLAVGETDEERIVRGADDRRAGVVCERGEERADLERRGCVESRGRLVGDDDGRPRREDPRERDPLALSGREEVDAALGVRGEADRRESIGRPLARVVGLDPAKREAELDVLARREEPGEARRLPDDGDAVAPERLLAPRGRARTRPSRRGGSRPRREGRGR